MDTPIPSGSLVTESLEYDGGREVTVFVPATTAQMLVYAADGRMVSQWGTLLETAGVPPTMIVGVHGLADETSRLHEYSPVFDPERFAAHEEFFVHTVRRWTQARFDVSLPAEQTAIYGASAGGELALALGLRHPDVYGAILACSPGAGFRPGGVLQDPPRTYLMAGIQEPFFLDNARRWAAALRQAGAEVEMKERVGTHGDAIWREEFPAMVSWAVARGRSSRLPSRRQ